LRSAFERLDLASSQFIQINAIQSSYDLKFCSHPYQSVDNQQNGSPQQQIPHCNLQQAPKITNFYGRQNELLTLSQWLENPNINLISVLGIFGIGKSTLVRHFLDLNTQPFDAIIWKNLQLFPSLSSLLIDILTELKINHYNLNNDSLNQFIKLLTQKRFLIILDNLEVSFTPQKLAGEFKPEYQDFAKFFKTMGEIEQKSKLIFIFISQEQSPEMQSLQREKCLNLLGLKEVKMLNDYGLQAEEQDLLELINLYEGNPFYLENIVCLIRDIFEEDVQEFLAKKNIIITQQMQSNFDKLFKRLSEIEQKIVLQLSQLPQFIERKDLRQNLDLSLTDFANSLQSLQHRHLVFKIKEKNLFQLSPTFREYINNFLTKEYLNPK
jgi:hypothetical protein